METSTQDLQEALCLPGASDLSAPQQTERKLDLTHLNDAQRDSIQSNANFVEVLAGPGSGKTMVICHRIEHLVKIKHVDPAAIVTVTFTNRAAKEMKERTVKLIGQDQAKFLMMGTFHHVCAVLLRKYGQQVGLSPDYTILDSTDSSKVIETALADLRKQYRFSNKDLNKWTVVKFIGTCKNNRTSPDDAERDVEAKKAVGGDTSGVNIPQICARVYKTYQSELKRLNCLDFDDLLGYVVDLFRTRPDTLRHIAARYKHVLVDEWQDTSTLQYEIAKGLCSVHQNLFVVGDPDQSIYSWRFAKMENITRFRKDFRGAEVVKLEHNYRSSGHILKFAHALIAQDARREEKNLICTMATGHPVFASQSQTVYDEARYIATTIKNLKRSLPDYSYGHTAILFRTNFQSRALEEALLREAIPHRVIGGVGYYERREIKDLISFLRLIGNPHDDFSLTRAINIPPRGIGDKWLGDARAEAQKRSCSMWSYIQTVRQTKSSVHAFVGFIESLHQQSEQGAPSMALLDAVLETTHYLVYLKESEEATFANRAENVEELRRACYTKDMELAKLKMDQLQGVSEPQSEGDPMEIDWSRMVPLQHFLTHLALVAGDPREGKSKYEKIDSINLMTMHAAKGLEWPVVFVCGCDAYTVPHNKTDNPAEERRLLYVSATRAKGLLYLTYPEFRMIFIEGRPSEEKVGMSPFLKTLQARNKAADFIYFGDRLINFAAKNESNELIARLCRNFKLVEKSAEEQQHQQRRLLVRSNSDGGSFTGQSSLLSPSMIMRRGPTQLLDLTGSQPDNDDDVENDDDDDRPPPSRSESLKMLPLKFELEFEDIRYAYKRKRPESKGSSTTTLSRSPVASAFPSASAAPKRSSVEPPSPKRSKAEPAVKINLVDDDDGAFTTFEEKQEKKRVKAKLNDQVTAAARAKGLKKMQKEAAKQAAILPPRPVSRTKRVEIVAPPVTKYPMERPRSQRTSESSSTGYYAKVASGVSLPTLKKKS